MLRFLGKKKKDVTIGTPFAVNLITHVGFDENGYTGLTDEMKAILQSSGISLKEIDENPEDVRRVMEFQENYSKKKAFPALPTKKLPPPPPSCAKPELRFNKQPSQDFKAYSESKPPLAAPPPTPQLQKNKRRSLSTSSSSTPQLLGPKLPSRNQNSSYGSLPRAMNLTPPSKLGERVF